MKKIFILFITILMISFVACKDDGGDAASDRDNAESALKQMDNTLANLTLQSSFFAGISQMPPGLVDDIPLLPYLPPVIESNVLGKNSPQKFAITADSSFLSFFAVFDELRGTHTFNSVTQEWENSDTPNDEVIIIYPYVDLNDNSNHTMQIRMYGVIANNSGAQMNMEIKVDGTTQLTIELTVLGTNLTNPDGETVITSVSASGTIKDDTGASYNYSINLSDNQYQFSFGASGTNSVTVTITGNNLLDPSEDAEQVILQVSISSGDLDIIITDLEGSSETVGQVNYNNNKVADLVIIDGELYFEFTNGDQVPFAELMPNSVQLLSGFAI